MILFLITHHSSCEMAGSCRLCCCWEQQVYTGWAYYLPEFHGEGSRGWYGGGWVIDIFLQIKLFRSSIISFITFCFLGAQGFVFEKCFKVLLPFMNLNVLSHWHFEIAIDLNSKLCSWILNSGVLAVLCFPQITGKLQNLYLFTSSPKRARVWSFVKVERIYEFHLPILKIHIHVYLPETPPSTISCHLSCVISYTFLHVHVAHSLN